MDPMERARAWACGDPDPEDRKALEELIRRRDERALAAAFEPTLEFGTAGIRGIVGPGPARFNRAVVRRVTRAVADHYAGVLAVGRRLVVVGFDARRDSQRFAREAVGVFAAAGFEVAVFPRPIPTPLVAFAAREFGAAAAVAITASHNPAEYNGYKLYGPDAIQIIPPVDSEIAERMQRLGPAVDIPCDPLACAFDPQRVTVLGEKMEQRYLAAALAHRPPGKGPAPIRIAYTPLHGVGGEWVQRLLRSAGYPEIFVESSQATPDGEFPTVSFPNPEEPFVLGRGLALAEGVGADLLIANDPDADRLAAALPDAQGVWHVLTGNQLGVVMLDYLLSSRSPRSVRPLVLSTLVSTPLSAAIAASYQARFEVTLTGFKWLWSAALELVHDASSDFCLAFEEALGYSTHPDVRDKDGIAAALVFCDWVSDCKRRDRLAFDQLGELYRRHGVWGSAARSVVRPGAEGLREIQGTLHRIRTQPPSSLGGCAVERVVDFQLDASRRPRWLGAAEVLLLELTSGRRAILRPSGTEPKLKLYADWVEQSPADGSPMRVFERATAQAEAVLLELERYLLAP